MSVEDVRALKQKIDRFALLELAAEPGDLGSDIERAQRKFLSDNPFLLRNESWGWMTTSSKLVADHADTLQSIEKVLDAGWSSDLDTTNLVGSLESLISQSTELERIRTTVNESLIYDEFVVMYAPLHLETEFRLHVVEEDYSNSAERKFLVSELTFEAPVDRYMHCLVVVPPDKEAVVIQRMSNPSMAATLMYEGPTLYDGTNEVLGIDELLETCSAKVSRREDPANW